MRFGILVMVVLAFSCSPRDRGGAEAPSVVLVGAGDIAGCATETDEATAKLLDAIPGTVFTTGDNAYANGAIEDYRNCYEPTWGRHKGRTRPALGNHDFRTPAAAGYFEYFGSSAGTRGEGWYSYELGAWHVVVLNSNCTVVGCGPDSPQGKWLAADLAASKARCTLAYWHHPRWGGGRPDPGVQPFWDVLYANGADLVVNGHDHFYERLAPVDPQGAPDPARGIRQITAGMGGISLYDFAAPALPITEVRDDKTFGVIALTLGAKGYDWRFVPVAGSTFTDAGTTRCH